MKIDVYTSPNRYPKEIYWIHTLLESGVENIHIYKPNWDEKRLTAFINEIDFSFYNQLIIHAHDYLLEDCVVHGFHFSQKFINDTTRPEILLKMNTLQERGHKICLSIHDIDSYDRDYFDYADYVVLSPVYPSLSKPNHHPTNALDKYQSFIKKYTDKNFIALGGVTPEKLETLESIGFKRAALLGYIWNEGKNPLEQLNQVFQYESNHG